MARRFALLAILLVGCAKVDNQSGGGTADLSDGNKPDLTDTRLGFGKECIASDDCSSGYCYRENKTDPKGRCTIACTKDCPDGFECKTIQYNNTTEVDVCVPAKETMCNRCQVHRDCGDSSDLCITIGGGNDRFCSVDCAGNPGVCPAGFTCQKLGTSAGEFADAMQCIPINSVCCIDADKDGRGKGDGCIAKDCNDTDPRIHDDAKEVCDGVDNDCMGGADVGATDCKPAECSLGQFGYFERGPEPCTAGKCVMQSAKDCGLYTCDGGGEDGDKCAAACDMEDDKKCIPPAHCDAGKCLMDLINGSACNETSDCVSNHCQNGFCCASGDCCQQPSDCPGAGMFIPVCDNPATCQGTRGASTCTDFRCGTANGVPDDTACTMTVEANKCGFYKSIYCTGAANQTAPMCPTSCTSHADCDPNGFCNPQTKTCVEDLDDGGACAGDNARCKSAHCQNGFCCASGDCCAVEADCPTTYSTKPVCNTPTACQGTQDVARCTNFTCSTQKNVENDSACTGAVEASTCGPYLSVFCNGNPGQTPPTCPTTCSSSANCDPNAYCNAQNTCVLDEPAGRPCRGNEECQSAHCQNGFCCASGDCCAKSSDCGAQASAPVCNSQTTCQGTRVDGVCNNSFQCVKQTIDDDSACVGLVSNACGPYPSITCTSAQMQPSNQSSLCSTTCTNDGQCDTSAHCTAGACVPDVGPGGYCMQSSDCNSGLFCVDNVCCNSACNGTCEACDLTGSVGTCTAVPDGQDPAGECGGVSCAAYYLGFTGSTCYKKADVSAAQASCNGSRACRTVAQECTAQTAKGPAAVTCDATCQTPTGGTCTGTTAGACTNLNPGNNTCGLGVCQVTSPKCVGGMPNACVPNGGAASTETCNSIDDNCDGTIDNGAFADSREPNNDCTTYNTLPGIGSNQTQTQNTVTLYSSGDVDYFRINATETDSSCACCDFFCTDEDYRLVLTLTVPAGAGSYTFCTDTACGSVGNNCQTVNAGASAIWNWSLDGACGTGSDSYTVYVRIAPGNAPGYQCAPYTLKYQFVAGLCL